jgi:hypothetical protein
MLLAEDNDVVKTQALPTTARAPNGLKAGQFPDFSPQRTRRTQRRMRIFRASVFSVPSVVKNYLE